MGLLLLMGNSFSGALDSLGTGLESAWSVGRRLRAGYSGPVIRVRRSSDNAEQDFSGSGASGAVDPAAVVAFCGAGDGFLAKVYDQSSKGRDWIQATLVEQPSVCSSGAAITQNGRLSTQFATSKMTVSTSQAIFKFLHDGTKSVLYAVMKPSDTAGFKTFLRNAGTSASPVGLTFGITNVESLYFDVYDGAGGNVLGVTKGSGITTASVITIALDLANATAASRDVSWLDGSVLSGSNGQTGTPSSSNADVDLHIGARPVSNTQPFAGAINEMVMWSIDNRASRTIWEANAKTFWGTP